MSLRQTRRRRLKTARGKRRRSEQTKAKNGSQSFLERFEADQVGLRKARKTWTGYWMQRCMDRTQQVPCATDIMTSDGPTPEAKVKQILAIAPILPGQTVSQTHSRSHQSNGSVPRPSEHADEAPSQSSQPHPTSDLIDFGQSSQPVQQQQHSSNQHLLESQHTTQGLQQPLEPDDRIPIKRQDTITKEVDEFVDAEP